MPSVRHRSGRIVPVPMPLDWNPLLQQGSSSSCKASPLRTAQLAKSCIDTEVRSFGSAAVPGSNLKISDRSPWDTRSPWLELSNVLSSGRRLPQAVQGLASHTPAAATDAAAAIGASSLTAQTAASSSLSCDYDASCDTSSARVSGAGSDGVCSNGSYTSSGATVSTLDSTRFSWGCNASMLSNTLSSEAGSGGDDVLDNTGNMAACASGTQASAPALPQSRQPADTKPATAQHGEPLFEPHSGLLPRASRRKGSDDDADDFRANLQLATVPPHLLSPQLQCSLRKAYGPAATADDMVRQAPGPYRAVEDVLGLGKAACWAWREEVERAWASKLRCMQQQRQQRAREPAVEETGGVRSGSSGSGSSGSSSGTSTGPDAEVSVSGSAGSGAALACGGSSLAAAAAAAGAAAGKAAAVALFGAGRVGAHIHAAAVSAGEAERAAAAATSVPPSSSIGAYGAADTAVPTASGADGGDGSGADAGGGDGRQDGARAHTPAAAPSAAAKASAGTAARTAASAGDVQGGRKCSNSRGPRSAAAPPMALVPHAPQATVPWAGMLPAPSVGWAMWAWVPVAPLCPVLPTAPFAPLMPGPVVYDMGAGVYGYGGIMHGGGGVWGEGGGWW